jgi:hypothetical protein
VTKAISKVGLSNYFGSIHWCNETPLRGSLLSRGFEHQTEEDVRNLT